VSEFGLFITGEMKFGTQMPKNIFLSKNLTFFHNTFVVLYHNFRKSYIAQILHALVVSDVRQVDTHAAEALVLEPRHYEVETAVEMQKRYKSPRY
jgi:hypothetical protein